MTAQQKIFRIRRSYNQWVNDQTLEDYALRFTAIASRRWSLRRVANTALGAISFLALEAIGGAITLNYGFVNATSAIAVVTTLIFLTGLPICYYAARYGVDIDLLTRGAGFGYIGSTATSLIYASFTFIFFALEAAIMAKALELTTGLPLAWGYVLSSLVVIPLVFHGITFISRFQLWSQPLWVSLQIIPLAAILLSDFSLVSGWQSYEGTHQKGHGSFNLLLFGAAASVMFALVAQIGEQVDFLRFLPEKTPHNRVAWWSALILGGPGWIIVGGIKLMIGSFLAFVALAYGVPWVDAADPTAMYTVAYSYLTGSDHLALGLAGLFVVISQLKINVTNAYAGSIAWSNFFSRLTHSHPGRVVWLVFNVAIALLLMELGVYQTFEETLSVYAVVAVAWVGSLVADLVINKPLGLSPRHIEFKRAYLHDVNPVGTLSVLGASVLGIVAYLGFLGDHAQALTHFLTLLATFIVCPSIALLTRGQFYIARQDQRLSPSPHLNCIICENDFERQDMAFCPAYDGPICSLCCSLDSRCRDACKTVKQFSQQFRECLQRTLPSACRHHVNSRLLSFVLLLLMIAGVTALLLSLVYSGSITPDASANSLIASALWKVFFILFIVAGVIAWLFVLAHESRIVAQEESNRQNQLLLEEIAAHQQTDYALQCAKEQAEAANNAKTRYLTGISHELRTPLNSILGYAQLLENDTRITGDWHRQLRVIRRGAEHLTDLIEGLLDISKIEAGRLEIQSQPFDLINMLGQIVDMFHLQAREKGLQFNYRQLTGLPGRVQGDEKRVRQILINLLSNALKYTERGQVDLSIRYRNQVAEIRVRDTGVGIPAPEMERIFRPFERIRLPGVPAVNGSGLGLTICRLLVDIMGGDLKVEANPQQGVTFTVWLMLASTSPVRPAIPASRTVYGYHGHRRTLLIVDDDAAHRGLLQDLLSPLGFVVMEAPDGESCLHTVQTFVPDAFFIDRNMPGIDGLSLARTLRNNGIKKPVIMISANAREDLSDADSSPKAYTDYVVKPVRLDQVTDKLGQLLNLQWHYQPLYRPAQNGPVQHVPSQHRPIQTTPTHPLPASQFNPTDGNALIDDLIGWAEIGALGKVRAMLLEIDRLGCTSPAQSKRLLDYADRLAFEQLIDSLKALQC